MAKQIQETTDSEELIAELKQAQAHADKLYAVWQESKRDTKDKGDEWQKAQDHVAGIIRDEDRPLLNQEDD